ncbi:DUF502 domain-containing protein [Rhabdochlamydiaceae symbiont of Dictyostelium giganteum]|uniref:DUF502 domain-containing protein n=1 Tax=Rhabdochlamydiaceae symbiont of Dictyostelium giganteum TaxID=3342349 RepID=UPI00384FD809
MKKSFSAGLMILLPILISLWLFQYIFDLITAPIYHTLTSLLILLGKKSYFEGISNSFGVMFLSRIIALLVGAIFITFLGFIGRKFVLKSLIHFINQWIFKIPLLGTIYRLSRDLVKAVLSPQHNPLQETVLIPFPSKTSLSMGFITGRVPDFVQRASFLVDTTVFIPTAPHPIAGYMIFCLKKDLHTIQLSPEDALKFLISCGTALPSS